LSSNTNVKKLVQNSSSLLALMHANTLFARSTITVSDLRAIIKQLTYPLKHFNQLTIC
jgi:hypothetical protein